MIAVVLTPCSQVVDTSATVLRWRSDDWGQDETGNVTFSNKVKVKGEDQLIWQFMDEAMEVQCNLCTTRKILEVRFQVSVLTARLHGS